MPRTKYPTRLLLTEQNFQRLSLGSPAARSGRSPTSPTRAPPFRGVNVHADRRNSLDNLCAACEGLFMGPDTLDLLWGREGNRFSGSGSMNGMDKGRARVNGKDEGDIALEKALRRNHSIPKDVFETSALQGCRLCSALRKGFREELRTSMFESEKRDSLVFPFSFDSIDRTITFRHPQEPEVKAVMFDLVAYRGSAIWPIIKRKPPEVDVASERSFRQAREWLVDCEREHGREGNCPRLRSTPLPKRVVDVSEAYPRLHFSNGAPGRYACLSYRWGDSSWQAQIVTTRENVDEHSSRILYENLPKSVQDAITVTRKLRLRYVWIDSLCIVQNDSQEREQELEKMGSIFTNAYVTISAATAKSCKDGFLHERQMQSRAYTPAIKVPCFSPTGMSDRIMLFQRGSATTREPIHDRAWTLQEDLLSVRILFYGDFELVWSCATAVRTISGIQAEICDTGETEMARLRRMFAEGVTQTYDIEEEDSDRMARWEDLIREYSRRKLSRPDDKLPALAGLAAKFQLLVDSEYLAGLWSCWLPTHLLWKITGPGGTGVEQEVWRAPTWSWLSMDSSVEIDVENKENFQVMARVENYVVSAVKPFHLFGRLKSASITLRGIVNEESEEGMHRIVAGQSQNSRGTAEVVLDVAPVMSSSYYPEYTFLTIGSVERPPKVITDGPVNERVMETPIGLTRNDSYCEGKVAIGLVLSPAKTDKDSYLRVGWFKSLPSQTTFLTGEEKVVTIT